VDVMTMASTNTRPRRSGQFAKLYAGSWTVLALLALAYMITLATNPSILGNWTPERSTPETNEGQRAAARFATDLSGLRQSFGDIQREMAALNSSVQAGTSRDKEMLERISILEERIKPQAVVEAAAPAAPPAPKTAVQRQAEARAQKIAEKAATVGTAPAAAETAAATAEASQSRFVVLNAPALPANSIATGSIQAPPAQGVPAPPAASQASAAFGPGAIKAAAAPSGPAGVEIASGPSLDSLRLNWSMLAERHAPQLKNLEARYTSAGEGQPYQLIAGPVASTDEAKRVCAQLQAKRVACRVTSFGGNAL
jgi:SPOR domain